MPRFDGRFFPSSTVSDWAAGKFGTPGWYPAAPTGVTPTEGDQQVALSWDAGNANGSDIAGYKVEKNDGSWSTVTSDTGSDTTSYTATGLTNGTAYTFRVTAINSVGVGEAASSISASKTPRGVPGTPGTLSLAAGSPVHTVIDLSWSAPGSTNGAAITGYKIQRSTDGSSWSNVVADTGSTGTTYSNTGLTHSTTYHYRVAAINVAGAGAYGNEPSRDTAPGPVVYTTVGSPTVRTYGAYTSLHWTGTGSFTISDNPGSRTFDVWVVSGGGGGSGTWADGGGGAGGAEAFTSQTIGNAAHTITIGGGGAAGGYPVAPSGVASSFAISGAGSLATTGGGGGGGTTTGSTGGSGGGGGGPWANPGGSGTAGEGEDGGDGFSTAPAYSLYCAGGGGGGKGGAGSNAAHSTGGDGGTNGTNNYADGTTSGTGVGTWAGGGGGACNEPTVSTGGSSGGAGAGEGQQGGTRTVNATANTGSGGGGGGSQGGSGAGGSGAVVVRWVT